MQFRFNIDLEKINEANGQKAGALFKYLKNTAKNKTPLILRGTKVDGFWDCDIYECAIPASHFTSIKLPAEKNKDNCLEAYVGKDVIMGIRPENIHNEEDLVAQYKDGVIDADVEVTELMGAETYLYMNCEGQSINARVSPTNTARPGDKIKIAFETAKIHLFDKDTEITICN